MQLRLSTMLCTIASLLLISARALAFQYHAGSLSGLMLQPTSNYYHAVFGGYGEIRTNSEAFILRGGYVQRPKFQSAGFVDQDYASFAMIGTKVTKAKTHGLYAFLGGGQVGGYIKASHHDDGDETEPLQKRFYQLPGLVAAIEYGFHAWGMDAAIAHQSFIGYVDNEQLKAYVAWPYNFVFIKLGFFF